MNIFEEWICAWNSDIYDVLDTFKPHFEKAGIEEIQNIDLLYSDEPEELCTNLKRILLESAQENGIIPEDWDLDLWFNIHESFSVTPQNDNVELVEKVIDDFENWCGLYLCINSWNLI